MKLLLEWGNDLHAVNENKQDVMHAATHGAAPAAIQFLYDKGVGLGQKDNVGRTPFVVADENYTDKSPVLSSLANGTLGW